MKAWCEQCGRYVDYTQEMSHTEELEIKGTKFNVRQIYGICPVCGEEVLSNALADSNVQKAHNAYRRALGSITTEEIKAILDKYSIGAHPLSLLLGWGANTIERQMKHTIPDREHAAKLRALNDPSNMLVLLENGKNRISSVAYERAMRAVKPLVPQNASMAFVRNNLSRSAKLMSALLKGFAICGSKAVYKEEYTTPCIPDPIFRHAFNH